MRVLSIKLLLLIYFLYIGPFGNIFINFSYVLIILSTSYFKVPYSSISKCSVSLDERITKILKYYQIKNNKCLFVIINALTFIQQTMEMLSTNEEQLKTRLDIDLTHQEML